MITTLKARWTELDSVRGMCERRGLLVGRESDGMLQILRETQGPMQYYDWQGGQLVLRTATATQFEQLFRGTPQECQRWLLTRDVYPEVRR
jgi:hypothetical protein